jgi:hypothetical protein
VKANCFASAYAILDTINKKEFFIMFIMSSLLFEHLSKSWFEVLGFAIAGFFFHITYLKRSKEGKKEAAKAYLDCIYVSALSALLTFFVPYKLALGVYAFFLVVIFYFKIFKQK